MQNQKIAIVTGASKGIGAGCAREFSSNGYSLALMARSESIFELAEEIGAIAVQGSVTEQGDIDRLVEVALDQYGHIDAVLNCTGNASHAASPVSNGYDPLPKTHLLNIPDRNWHDALDIYILNVIRMARAVTPHFQKQKHGTFLNISAFCAVEPSQFFPADSTIRTALSGFTKLYSDQYASDGIRMNNLVLGYVDNYTYAESLLEHIPMERAGKLRDEVATTAMFLLSDQAGYITGQNIVVDGGLTRSN